MKKVFKLIVVAGIYVTCNAAAQANTAGAETFATTDLVFSAGKNLENAVSASLSSAVASQLQSGKGLTGIEPNLAPQLAVEPAAETTYLSSISEPVALSLLGVLLAVLGTLKRRSPQ